MNEFTDSMGFSNQFTAVSKGLMAAGKLTKEERQAYAERFSQPVAPLPDETPAIDLMGEPFSRYFRKSTFRAGYYFIRGTSQLWENGWDDHAVFLATLRAVRMYARTGEEHWWAAPGCSIENITREYELLDGGFFSDIGNTTGPRGAWIFGTNTLRLVCYELRIAQPRMRHCVRIPTHEDLRKQALVDRQRSAKE